MRKFILISLVVASAASVVLPSIASAQQAGGQGRGGHSRSGGSASDSDGVGQRERLLTDRRKKLNRIPVRFHSDRPDCSFEKVRLTDDFGNVYYERIRFCDNHEVRS